MRYFPLAVATIGLGLSFHLPSLLVVIVFAVMTANGWFDGREA